MNGNKELLVGILKKQKTFYPEDLTKYSILSYELI